ncbi:hypothetical protein BAUCODRAFT_38665 [Baudoinia panamericana UAMH 10762]|uniref:Cytochrome P450 monooxygenase n=1 Tax=Baudoinia panamericana (strain UAMH 10762) TaxID=717646 RepID=M2LC87_BAUPA|nr:uncharacterized protein BAUCODRAFT_38665 [Baudoinia panamericana UAMH 10762]EMC91552.1 hypothetical protein BAUCODRAFT_38665 [Baudoinia panamericana UAMH 10762]
MAIKQFYLYGSAPSTAIDVDITPVNTIDELKRSIAAVYGVVQAEGIAFQAENEDLPDLHDVENASHPVGITIDGHAVRAVPGPRGLPYVGNYFEVYPDHLGNNQRLFEKYGPIFKTTNMGKTVCQTNDPILAQIAFTESDFFSKEIVDDHPLHPIKQDAAGVFLSDTHNPSWKMVHKFLPPALGPKAVRHYAPIMNDEVRVSFPVFDELSARDEAWNPYQYMLKLSSAAVGKIVLGQDFHHFESVDTPFHRLPLAMAELLSINKKIASMGQWYSQLPFGDPKRLRDLQQQISDTIVSSIHAATAAGTEDLPLQDAALKSADVIDYLTRAVDADGQHLPVKNMVAALTVAAGAGFTTTSSLLSWLVYGLVAYDGMQERLLQEMVDHDFNDDTEVTPEMLEDLPMLDKYIKEMQRRHNPSYQPGRTAQRDVILPGGYKLNKGDVVIVALHHIHMNPKIWNNPDLFDPDRWDTERVKNRGRTDYVPFAAGQRMCIGFNFALQEIKIFMCKLVWRYRWLKEGEPESDYDPFFQLIRPINLYVRTQKRDEWPSKSSSMMS